MNVLLTDFRRLCNVIMIIIIKYISLYDYLCNKMSTYYK